MNTLQNRPLESRDFHAQSKTKSPHKPSAMNTLHKIVPPGGVPSPILYNRAKTMPTDNRTALLNLIATLSFKLGDFTLASGQKSDYYIDCRITTLHAEGGRLSGLVLYDLIQQLPNAGQIEAVGGLTMGADPLVSNTASASAWAAA